MVDLVSQSCEACRVDAPRLSDAEISSLYKKALIYVFPSVEEGFGIPILEAFAMKIPVVTSNAAAMVEIADGAAEHYNAGDQVELFKTLTKLIISKAEKVLKNLEFDKTENTKKELTTIEEVERVCLLEEALPEEL